ncbi:hypothetical protein NDU88_002164 [Pleurodeles waltl]|uniref:Uncharacterized protein n=1 Tax=Pleurodeles waltl TaxID=8319 RepID=A0AAV7SAU1_PLEWA|nr:hypothetical protein NDU88_002164 [Pleurodeles waltl]
MGTLITQAKRRMEAQMNNIEILIKELEGISNQQEVQLLLEKMGERTKKKEDELKTRFTIEDAPALVSINDLAEETAENPMTCNKERVDGEILKIMGFTTNLT